MSNLLLEMKQITKQFPGVKALDNVNLQVQQGEIHALVGENGAGKSTLMNILSGVYPYGTYDGDILFDGNVCQFHGIKQSENVGISIIHQELALAPNLSVAENVFLGNERKQGMRINWNQTHAAAQELLNRVGFKKNISLLVNQLSPGEQQLVEIAKALSKKVRLLILDEPTSSLNEEDSQNLLKLLLQLKAEGITCIIISHKLNEIRQVADRVTILRDGKTIETIDSTVEELAEERIIKGMVGREIVDVYPKRGDTIVDEVLFETKDWCVYAPEDSNKKFISNMDIHVRKGEIIGISGLMGAGRTEFALSVFGRSYGSRVTGTVLKAGKPIDTSTVSKAIDNGIAYVTEDRKGTGLVLPETIQDNIVLVSLPKLANKGVRNKEQELSATLEQIKALNVKCSSHTQKVVNLSGGNQQKVVLAKWILSKPDVLILDEPTRGIDVGAKREIYCIMNDLVAQGKSVIFISSEMPELLGMCDRIYVVHDGRLVGELQKEEFSQENVMRCIMSNL